MMSGLATQTAVDVQANYVIKVATCVGSKGFHNHFDLQVYIDCTVMTSEVVRCCCFHHGEFNHIHTTQRRQTHVYNMVDEKKSMPHYSTNRKSSQLVTRITSVKVLPCKMAISDYPGNKNISLESILQR